MKLCGLVPNFYIQYLGVIYIFPPSVSYAISIFLYCMRELSAQPPGSREKGKELPPSSGWRQFPVLPSAPAVEPRVHINHEQTNFQFGNLWIINGNN
jgi:hypothetical protein